MRFGNVAISLTIIVLMIINLSVIHSSSTLTKYVNNSMTYDLPINGYLINVELRILNDTWILSKPIIMEYKIRVEKTNKPLKEFLIFLKVDVDTVNFSDNVGVYTLAKIRDYSTYSGEIKIFLPSTILNMLAQVSFIDILPTLLIIVKNNTYSFNLLPYRLIVSNSSLNEVLIGSCSSSLNTELPVELCVRTYYSRSSQVARSDVPLIVSVRSLLNKPIRGVLTVIANDLILSSKVINVSKGLETYMSIPLSALLSITKGNIIKLNTCIFTLNMTDIVSTSLYIPINVRISEPIIKLEGVPTMIFENDDIEFSVEIYNPNVVPLHVHEVLISINNVSVKHIKFSGIVRPKSSIKNNFRLRLNGSGNYIIQLTLNYSIGAKRDTVTIKSNLIKVIKALIIRVMNNLVKKDEVVNIEVIAFKPVKNIVLMVRKGNYTYRLAYIGSFTEPNIRNIGISVSLEPGNYTLYAKSVTNNITSNEVNITVLNKSFNENKRGQHENLNEIIGKASIIKKLHVVGKACLGCNVSVRIVLSDTNDVDIRLYRYENRFNPPWILQPLLNIRKLNSSIYEFVFRAPTKEGTYTYRVEVIKGDKVTDRREFNINVKSEEALVISKPLIPPELFYPIVATSALASLILFRRYSKRRE